MIGHSHQQYIRKINGKILLNPGSIGQNRQLINVSNYALLDSSTGKIELKSIAYDVDILISEMVTRGYPSQCINYYKAKKRL
jgi:protein phosphatase